MDKNVEQQLREAFNKGLSEAHRNGLLQGSRAICKVVFDKANDNSKSAEERIADIKKFCEVSLTKKN